MNECSECGGPEGIHRAGCPEERAVLPPERSEPLFDVADAARVFEWARSYPRKQPSQAFTAGAERQAAYWIEWAWSNPPNAGLEPRGNRVGSEPLLADSQEDA